MLLTRTPRSLRHFKLPSGLNIVTVILYFVFISSCWISSSFGEKKNVEENSFLGPSLSSEHGMKIKRYLEQRSEAGLSTTGHLIAYTLVNKGVDNQMKRDTQSSVYLKHVVSGVNAGVFHTSQKNAMLFSPVISPDTAHLACLSDVPAVKRKVASYVNVWDIQKKQLRYSLPLNGPSYQPLCFSPDGKHLAFIVNMEKQKGVKIIHVLSGKTYKQFHFSTTDSFYCEQLTFSSDGKRIAWVSAGFLSIWDFNTNQLIYSSKYEEKFSKNLLGLVKKYKPWNPYFIEVPTGKFTKRRVELKPDEYHWKWHNHKTDKDTKYVYNDIRDLQVVSVNLSSDLSRIHFSYNQVELVFELSSGKVLSKTRTDEYRTKNDFIFSVISPDGKSVARATTRGNIRVVDISTKKTLFQFNEKEKDIRSLSFSRNGTKLLSITDRNQISIWDNVKKKKIQSFRGESK